MATYRRWKVGIAVVTAVAAVIGIVAVLQVVVMREKDTEVNFILPVRYTGLFAVVDDPSMPSASACPSFQIPEQGIVYSADADALSRYHTAHAKYADGAKLAVEGFDKEQDVMLRYSLGALGRNNRAVHFFFVGSKKEVDKLEASQDFPERFRKLLK